MKKICVICANISDATSPRSMRVAELVKEFERQGNKIVVYTSLDPDSYNWMIQASERVQLKDLGKIKRGLPVLKKWKFFSYVIERILSILFLYPEILYVLKVKRALKQEIGEKYDLMISVAVPHSIHWGCATLSDKTRKSLFDVWVADCGDPFYLAETIKNKHPFYFKYIEKWAFKKPDYISIPVATAKMGYYPQFWSKLVIIPQGIDFSKIKISKISKNSQLTFIYAGGFLKWFRDPTPFLSYLEKIPADFKFIVYTKSGYEEYFQNISITLKNKIIIRNYIPREDLIFEISQVDFLINFENGTQTQMPSKLIDYALSETPILSIDTNKMDTSIIDEFFKGNYSNRYMINNVEQYNIFNVANSFLSICKDSRS